MFSNPRQVAPPGIEPGTYRTISESLYQCAKLPNFNFLHVSVIIQVWDITNLKHARLYYMGTQ